MNDDEEPKVTSQDLEEAAWLVVDELRQQWVTLCATGSGTPGLREAAESLTVVQAVLERERGRRQLRDVYYAMRAASD